ncbi:MAG: hypothetical protein JWL77_2691, partial [Chthonomonadaceae bacterium]|nr:hypothetical protein [Chthonomonadaceae bacterium]
MYYKVETSEVLILEFTFISLKIADGSFRFHLYLITVTGNRLLKFQICEFHRLTENADTPPARIAK